MPNRDKTGPEGKGPLTGNELGGCEEEKTLTSDSPDIVSPIYSPVPNENMINSTFDPELEDEWRRKSLKSKYFPTE